MKGKEYQIEKYEREGITNSSSTLTILCGKVRGWTQNNREGKVNSRRREKESMKGKTKTRTGTGKERNGKV